MNGIFEVSALGNWYLICATFWVSQECQSESQKRYSTFIGIMDCHKKGALVQDPGPGHRFNIAQARKEDILA